jgi:acyl-CoA reductase-like NAD-dependent aldehyde dehydrogenase
LVVYFDISADAASARIQNRAAGRDAVAREPAAGGGALAALHDALADLHDTLAVLDAADKRIDIHERDTDYLELCVSSLRQAAECYGWRAIPCFEGGRERTEGEIHKEVMGVLGWNI